ncbi:hypothetical protein Bca101_059742 [Brassica carinata]
MELSNDTKFYWACINEFREDTLWRKYFIDRAENTFEEKFQFLQPFSGFTRDDQYMGKRLKSGKPFGCPNSGGFHSGSPIIHGGQTVNGQWGQQPCALQWVAQQWGTPPAAQQWDTPPTSHQWDHHQLLTNRVNHQLLTNGVHHQILRNMVQYRMLSSGFHHRWLHDGVQHQLLNPEVLHQWLHTGVHHQMINNGVHLKVMCSMGFQLKLRPKVQGLMKKELQRTHHLEKYRAHINREHCSIFGEPNEGLIKMKLIKPIQKMKLNQIE